MTVIEKRRLLRRLGEAVGRQVRRTNYDVGYTSDERIAEAVVRELRVMGLITTELGP